MGRVAIWGYLVFALAAGAVLPIQFGINAQLAAWLGSSVRAALVSFVVGAVALAVVAIGGALGAFYVLGSIVAAPRLGAVTLFVMILAGQALASLAVDHFGWVGFEEHPINAARLGGVALLAAGVALVRFS